MKLPSPRTWLIVAAGVLLLGGGVVLYVVKNPPLPPGWEKYDCDLFSVSLPPGEPTSPISNLDGAFSHRRAYDVTHIPISGGLIEIIGVDTGEWVGSTTPDELLDQWVTRATDHPAAKVTVTSCEQFQCRGHPGRIVALTLQRDKGLSLSEDLLRKRCLIVLAKGWVHTVTVYSSTQSPMEEEIDLVFRTFRPK